MRGGTKGVVRPNWGWLNPSQNTMEKEQPKKRLLNKSNQGKE